MLIFGFLYAGNRPFLQRPELIRKNSTANTKYIKMKKWLYIPVIFLLGSQTVLNAQSSDERVYIQTDRDFYVKGETVHFIGYVIAGKDTIESTNIFVELLDSAGSRLAGISLPLIGAAAAGSLSIPATLQTENVFLRAYSDITVLPRNSSQFIQPLFPAIAVTSHSGEIQQDTITPPFFS